MSRHLHFDCFSGISGDMILGALVDAGLPFKDLVHGLKGVKLDGYHLRTKKVFRGSLQATKIDVVIRKGRRAPLSLSQIRRIIDSSTLPVSVTERGRAVFDRLARAEGLAHGVSPEKVQFHEVGVIDSLIDVLGSLLGCHLLGITRVTASVVNVGAGFIDTAHGRLPVPGPAVADLTRGIPVCSAGPAIELATPTGVALLGTLTQEFGALPLMRPTAIGYGAGFSDPKGWPNALRVFLGETVCLPGGWNNDVVVQIETNLDDLQPQAYELVMDRLFAVGAIDVTLTPVIMKRGRPGIVLSALASHPKAEAVAGIVLRETTALGLRMREVSRTVLPRHFHTVRLASGEVRIKVAEVAPAVSKAAPEYSDCRRIAEQTGRPVRDVMEEAMRGYGKEVKRKTEKIKRKR